MAMHEERAESAGMTAADELPPVNARPGLDDDILLPGKLNVPRPRSEPLTRPRLLSRLDRGLSGKLTLISAPAGFGKTTLLVDWAARRLPAGNGRAPRWRLAWLSLDGLDNDPARFLRYLLAALGSAVELDGRVSHLLQASPTGQSERVLSLLIHALEQQPHRVVLVLDDYHVISALAIHALLLFLLEHLPAQLHLVVCGRSDAPLALSRWRLREELTEIRAADLRFTVEETVQLVTRRAGEGLSRSQMVELAERTEGWPAGLQLALLSLHNLAPDARASFVEDFGGRHRYVFTYLIEEVLQAQPADVRQFLRQTAVLSRLVAPLCAAVTGLANPDRLLAQLADSNLFIVPLDERGEWYRYHPLFAEALTASLDEAERRALCGRAADWFASQGAIQEAIRYGFLAEEHDKVAQLVVQAYRQRLHEGHLDTLRRWLAALPPAMLHRHPYLALAAAWAHVYVGNDLELAGQIDAFYDGLVNVEADRRDAARGEMLVVQSIYASLYGQPDEALALADQAAALFPAGDHFLSAVAWQARGNAYRVMGQLASAVEAYEQSRTAFARLGDIYIAVVPTWRLAQVRIMQGRLRQGHQLFERVREQALAAGGDGLKVISELFAHLSDLYREWNDLDRARAYAEQGIRLARSGEFRFPLATGYLMLARVQAIRDAAAARATLVLADEAARQCRAPALTSEVALFEVRLDLAAHDLASAIEWARAYARPPTIDGGAITAGPSAAADLVLARVRLAEGRAAEAAETARTAWERSRAEGRVRPEIEAFILQALAHRATGDLRAAQRALGEALRLAEPEGYVRIFLDEGQPLVELLIRIRPTSPYAGRLLDHVATGLPSRPPSPAALADPLTPRELEILALVATGASNQAIAARLFISVGTVKTHLSHVYGKLSVQSRTQALVRARELGLIES